MFFWFSKVLDFLFSPLTWIIILFLLAVLQKNQKRKKRFYIITFAVLIFFTNNFLAAEAIRLWEITETDMNEEKIYDAAIVLGGGMITYDNSNGRHSFRDNTDRLLQALALYNNGRVKKILITGGSGSLKYRNMAEACLLKDFCHEMGFDTTAIIVECKSDNTFQNAKYTAEILSDSMDSGNYLLITSASHMRRARAVFKKAGFTFDIYPTNPVAGSRRYDPYFLFVPSVSAIITWEKFFKEVPGYLIYKIAGYL